MYKKSYRTRRIKRLKDFLSEQLQCLSWAPQMQSFFVDNLNSSRLWLLTEVFIKVEYEMDKKSRKSIVASHKTGQITLESAIDSGIKKAPFDCSCDMLPSFQQSDSRARLPYSSSSFILPLFLKSTTDPTWYLYHSSIPFLSQNVPSLYC